MTTPSYTALITGASSGIGARYAERFAARGYHLILVARREERLQALAQELQRQYGIRADVLKADLSEESGIRAVEARLQSDPTIALVINNAGTAKMGGVTDHGCARTSDDSYPEYHRSAAPELCGVGRLQPARSGDADQYRLHSCAACATGQRRLQRQQGVGAELYPRASGGVCRQRFAYSGGASGGNRDGSVAHLRRRS